MKLYMRLISTEGALRRPMIYDNHPSQSHPCTYPCSKMHKDAQRRSNGLEKAFLRPLKIR